MIFIIKPDLRRKSRLVAGGHVTDASMFDTYASTVSSANIRLLIYLIVHSNTNVVSGDIGTAYVNAFTEEKIFSHAGPEFGKRQGMKVILRKALYGLKSSANAWYHHLGNDLKQMGFSRSRLDPSIWYRDDKSGYDYFAHHVDDFSIVAEDPTPCLRILENKYVVTGGDIPDLYLGQTLTHDEDSWCIATSDYIQKCLVNVAKIIDKPKIGHQSTPNKCVWEPELYESPLLNDEFRHRYQQIIGIGIWLSTIGRIDITYAISTLSRYTHVAREEHYNDLVRVFEYLNKYPQRYIMVRDQDIEIDCNDENIIRNQNRREDMLKYYPDANDEWDSNYPKPIGKDAQVTIFVDADHASNKSNRRSITGIIIFIGNMP
ncbi:MAG: reverse transcriptase domain-containing protein, partial [bacterium]